MPVYLIRHATPDWNRKDIPYHLPPGPPLVEKGEAEAGELGRFLREAGAGHIYHSPLERCKQTAHISGAIAGVAAIEMQSLIEIQPGEKLEDILKRLWPTWEAATAKSEPVALVTHGGPIAILLEKFGVSSETLSYYKRTFDRNNPLPPAGAWQVAPLDGAWASSLAFVPIEYRKALMV